MKNNTKHQVICEQLPYGLKILIGDAYSHEKYRIFELDKNAVGICENKICIASAINTSLCFPILHEMDLTKEITVNGETFVPLDRLKDDPDWDFMDGGNIWVYELFQGKKTDMTMIPYGIIQKFKEWHMNYLDLPESDYVKYLHFLNLRTHEPRKSR